MATHSFLFELFMPFVDFLVILEKDLFLTVRFTVLLLWLRLTIIWAWAYPWKNT